MKVILGIFILISVNVQAADDKWMECRNKDLIDERILSFYKKSSNSEIWARYSVITPDRQVFYSTKFEKLKTTPGELPLKVTGEKFEFVAIAQDNRWTVATLKAKPRRLLGPTDIQVIFQMCTPAPDET